MRMSDVSAFFDRDPVYDAYTGAYLFNCQYSSFSDSSADGSTARRRAMSVAPGLEMPPRRVVQLLNQQWVAGIPISDSFLGDEQRQSFNLKLVTDDFTILTPGTAAAGGSGIVMAKAQKHYFKETSNSRTDSETDSFWNIFFALGEPVSKGRFLRSDSGIYYRIRQVYEVVEGLQVAQSDQLDSEALQTATFNVGEYDRSTDSYGEATVTVPVLAFEVAKFYRFRDKAESQILPGDITVMVPSTVPVITGTTFMMDGLKWTAIARQAEQDAWAVHARLA